MPPRFSIRRLSAYLFVITCCAFTACSSGTGKAAELLETARFEEKQSNREHALKLYNEIVSSYPDSPAAREASERIKALASPHR